MLDLKQLRSFESVAEHGSFSAAAKELGYTQPAISQHIASLEKYLQTPLVRRLPRAIRLTSAGEAMVVHAKRIRDRIEEAEAEIESIANLGGGIVRLASIPTAGASLVPAAIAAFREAHPAVEVRLSVACELEGATIIEAGLADIVLLVESELEPSVPGPGIERTHLVDDPFYLVMPTTHPRASELEVKLADFAGERWIHDNSPCPDGGIARRACEKAGFEPEVAFESDDYNAMQGYIGRGGTRVDPRLGSSEPARRPGSSADEGPPRGSPHGCYRAECRAQIGRIRCPALDAD